MVFQFITECLWSSPVGRSLQNARRFRLIEHGSSWIRGNIFMFKYIRCQFHQRFMYEFFVRKSFLAAFSRYISALAPKFCTNKARANVDEIDGRNVITINEFIDHIYVVTVRSKIWAASLQCYFPTLNNFRLDQFFIMPYSTYLPLKLKIKWFFNFYQYLIVSTCGYQVWQCYMSDIKKS